MSTKSGSNLLRGTATFQYFDQDWNAAPYFVKQARAQHSPRRVLPATRPSSIG